MKKQGALLIVDDNRNILTTVRMLLEPIFAHIITIATPNSIPAKLREEVVLFTAYADIQLAVTGIKEGAADFIMKPFDNEKMIRTMLEVRNKNKQAQKDLIVYADESLIAHVVTNILKNAVEANASSICIKAYTNEQEAIIIDITNNAGIISDDIVSHIFIPFFTTKKEGSGIGLSLSRQIMRVSGGSLSLHQDKAEGTTTFRIIIP